MTICSQHAGARAAWRCENCQRALCPDCAAHSGLTNSTAVLCVPCGGLARRLVAPRPRRPYWELLPTFLRAIFSLEGALQLLAVAAAMVLAQLIPIFGRLISWGIFIGYYFRVIMQAAHGAERLPEPGDFTDIFDLLRPVFRFAVASSVIWLPAVLYVGLVVGFSDVSLRGVSGAVVLLLVVLGVLYFPAAVIVAAITDSALAVINPAITVRMILRFPGEYMLTVAIWGALNVLDGFIWYNLMIWGNRFHIPIFVPILVTIVGLVVPVFTGFILGRLIYQNAEHFKLLGNDELHEPEWPDALPRGSRPPQNEAAAPAPAAPRALDLPPPDDDLEFDPLAASLSPAAEPPPVTPLDLPDEELEFDPQSPGDPSCGGLDLPPPGQDPGAVDPAVAGGGPVLDLPSPELDDAAAGDAAGEGPEPADLQASGATAGEAVAVAAPGPETPQDRLRSALRDDRRADALKVYKAIRAAGIHPELPVGLELRLAGFLENIGQYEEAVISCQRAAKRDMKGPFAARAIFTAARLLCEKLDNTTRAVELYGYVMDNFPQDELSMYAADAVSKLKRKERPSP